MSCLFQAAKGTFQKCKWNQNKYSVCQRNLCTTGKEDKTQKLEQAQFLFLFTNDGAAIELMFLPICVAAYTIQLYRPRKVSLIFYLQLKV